MTNEDKAREIANNNCTHICTAECSEESYFSSEIDCYKAAMEMAEWKEKQMIDKACEWLESSLENDLGYYGAADFVDSFRKAMEE